jgi:hypothetical protein
MLNTTGRRYYLLLPIFIFIGACSSILDSEDYDIEGIRATSSVVLPLAYGDLGIEDFINDTDSVFLKVYPDGVMYLNYEQNLISKDIAELFDFPDRSFINSVPLTAGTYTGISSDEILGSINSTLNFNFSPEQLDVLDFKEGIVTINTQILPATPANLNYHVTVELPDFSFGGVPFSKDVRGNTNFSLSGYHAEFTNNVTPVSFTFVKEPHSNSVVIAPGTSVKVTMSFNGMTYQFITGFFGDQTVLLPDESVKISVFSNSLKETNVSIAQPKAAFTLYNEYGIPTKVTFAFLEARKSDGSSLPIIIDPASPLRAENPVIVGETDTTEVAITNIGELMDFQPDEIYYRLDARINPPDYLLQNNFSFSDSELTVKLKVEIPLFGKVSDIVLSDTVEISLEDVRNSEIESGALKAKIENELPLDATLQIYLTDENFLILDSLFSNEQINIVKGSKVSADADLMSPGIFDEEIPIAKEKLDKLFVAKNLILKSTMKTVSGSAGTQVDVKIKSSYRMKAALGLKANLKINADL